MQHYENENSEITKFIILLFNELIITNLSPYESLM